MQSPSKDAPSTANLSSLVERDETPIDGPRPNIDAIVSSPIAAPNTAFSHSGPNTMVSALRTPNIDSRFRPAIEEMRPSKVHRSTSKQIRYELQSTSKSVHSQATTTEPDPAEKSTPTKLPGSWPISLTSSNFDFSFSQDDAALNHEAQRIMDSVRGEAAKIKAQLQAERAKQDRSEEEADQLDGVEGRRIAQPKGKAGRYSDVHLQEFKKMDSIAGHASVWKNRIHTDTSFTKPKADVETVEPVSQLPRSKSFKPTRSNDGDRLENLAPGKRSKKTYHEDTSAARPLSRGKQSEEESVPATSLKPGSYSGLPMAISTPTKASLARSASVKSMKTSMIPSLSRSNSTKMMGSPMVPRTEGSKKYISSLAKFGNLKSILHRQPKFTNDPIKVSAGTHPSLAAEIRMNKELPSLPSTPQQGLKRSPTLTRRADFTPRTNSKNDSVLASPSPSKIPALNLPRPTTTPKASEPILYPTLANSPNITTRTKIPTSSAPGDFTFRSDKTLPFSEGPSPVKVKTPTIRQVRPSGITTPLPLFQNLPPIPHGMPNKKRRRVDSDDEDVENIAPAALDAGLVADDDDEPRAKRLKSSPSKKEDVKVRMGSKSKLGGAGASSTKVGGGKGKGKGKGKGVLSLSRLNMLARPKNRR